MRVASDRVGRVPQDSDFPSENLKQELSSPMDRFFHSAGLTQSTLSLDEAESHHASRVLRKSPGDRIEIFDGCGRSALTEITLVKKDRVEVRILDRYPDESEPLPRIHLAVAPPKGDRFKWLIEKATELGVDQVTPLITSRTVVEPGAAKLDKLQAAVVAACKQSGRNRVMQVSENQPFSKLLDQAKTERMVLMGDPGGRVFAPDMIPVGTQEVTLLIGPEGGWSDEELAQVDQAGATRVRIAGGILRTETAAIQFAGLAAWARCMYGTG